MSDYDFRPKTLDVVITQCQQFDGEVKSIDPYFDHNGRIDSVGIWIETEEDGELHTDEHVYIFRSPGYWRLAGDGAGDPCTNGGNAMTGRDFG